MIKCHHCGHEFAAKTKFCPDCGKRLEVKGFSERPKSFWLTCVGAAGLVLLFLFDWVAVAIPDFEALRLGFNLYEINALFGEISGFMNSNFISGEPLDFSFLRVFSMILLILFVLSVLLLIFSLIIYKHKKRTLFAYAGFGMSAVVYAAAIVCVRIINSTAYDLSEGLFHGFFDMTYAPPAALILSIIGLIFFINPKDKTSPDRTKDMVVKLGLVAAITVIMTVTPLGTIRLPWTEATIAHLPTIVMALLGGPLYGAISGLVMGIVSMVYCILNPVGLNVFIANPLVSVLPRVLVGLGAGYLYKWLKAVFVKGGGRKKDYVVMSLSAAVGSAINTVGVLGMLFLVSGRPIVEHFNLLEGEAAAQWAGVLLSTLLSIAIAHGILEMIIITILATVLVKALRRAGYK